uniref:Uncharacterized protein n=1 Tax=Anguilla anguilla TaxID=7936 RepID=A0A0E9S5K2_ANGAN
MWPSLFTAHQLFFTGFLPEETQITTQNAQERKYY